MAGIKPITVQRHNSLDFFQSFLIIQMENNLLHWCGFGLIVAAVCIGGNEV